MTLEEAATAAIDRWGQRQAFVFEGIEHINHAGCARGTCLCRVFQRARDPKSLPSVQASFEAQRRAVERSTPIGECATCRRPVSEGELYCIRCGPPHSGR